MLLLLSDELMNWTERNVTGAGAGAGDLPALVRPAWVWRERPAPGEDGEEHRLGHRAARRRPGARPQVLPHRLLHGRRDHVELPQAHPAQVQMLALALRHGRGKKNDCSGRSVLQMILIDVIVV